MKQDKVKVGCKFGTEHYQVLCSISIPENQDDMATLARGGKSVGQLTAEEKARAAEFVVKMFERGWRIWCQEQSGARDYIQQSTVTQRKAEDFPAKVQNIIDQADPLAPPSRTGRPSKPKEVSITPEMMAAQKKGDFAKFSELLAAQGVKVNFKQ